MEQAPGDRLFGMKTRTLAFRAPWGKSRLDALSTLQSMIENNRAEGEAIRQISYVEVTPVYEESQGDGFVAHCLAIYETDLDITTRWGTVTD